MNASSEKKVVTTDRPRQQPNRKGAADPYTGRCLACPLSDPSPKCRGGVAQGLVRRRVKTPSGDAADSGTALVSLTMAPVALTKSSPHAAGAGHTRSGCGYLNRNARGLARRNRATPSHRCPWFSLLGRLPAQADHFHAAAIPSAQGCLPTSHVLGANAMPSLRPL
jgi:hypothetical protein